MNGKRRVAETCPAGSVYQVIDLHTKRAVSDVVYPERVDAYTGRDIWGEAMGDANRYGVRVIPPGGHVDTPDDIAGRARDLAAAERIKRATAKEDALNRLRKAGRKRTFADMWAEAVELERLTRNPV